jgi:plastocyanin
MTRAVALAVSLAVAALLGAADGSSARAQNPQLFGTVGPDFDIVLKDAQGNQMTKLDKGTYEIQIEDLSDFHTFHLRGPGVDERTTIGFTGTITWTVTFTDGTYSYFCDPHSSTMRGTFTAGNPVVATPPLTTVVTPKSKLVLTSGPRFVITLKTAAGKTVKKMKRGTYRMLVRDRSQAHNAHVKAPGFDKKTTLPFVGSQTWKVKLARVGTFRFLCDPHASTGMRGSAKIVR